MESTDQIERRARRSYELARLWRAVAGFSPILLVVAAAALLANRPSATLAFGLSTFGVGAALLWYGRDLRRAVLPGVVAGLVPLILVLCARHVEHMCMGDACMTLCLPVCAIGGVLTAIGERVRRLAGVDGEGRRTARRLDCADGRDAPSAFIDGTGTGGFRRRKELRGRPGTGTGSAFVIN